MSVKGPDGPRRMEAEEGPSEAEAPAQGGEARGAERKTLASRDDPSGLGWRAKLAGATSSPPEKETTGGVAKAINQAIWDGDMKEAKRADLPKGAQADFDAAAKQNKGPQAFTVDVGGKAYFVISHSGLSGDVTDKPHVQRSDAAVDDDTLAYEAYDASGAKVGSGTYE
jgi:hypothetical protein